MFQSSTDFIQSIYTILDNLNVCSVSRIWICFVIYNLNVINLTFSSEIKVQHSLKITFGVEIILFYLNYFFSTETQISNVFNVKIVQSVSPKMNGFLKLMQKKTKYNEVNQSYDSLWKWLFLNTCNTLKPSTYCLFIRI